MDHCPECGFCYADLPRTDIATALRQVAAQYPSRLRGSSTGALRRRSAPGVWTPLEYAAHVRDVLRVQHQRVEQALVEDAPTYGAMNQDERVVAQRDNDSDPEVVARELVIAAEGLAELLDRLDGPDWDRIGVYPWPGRTARDVTWIGRHTVHEQVHHLLDLNRGLQGQPGTPDGIGSG